MPSHKFADTVFVRIMRMRRDELKGRKAQRVIAGEMGWERPNNLSHALCGKTAFTLEQLPLALAAFEMSPHILKPMFFLAAHAYQTNDNWKGALPTITDAGLEEVFPAWLKDTIGAVARMTPAELPDDRLRKLVVTMEQTFAPPAEPIAEAT